MDVAGRCIDLCLQCSSEAPGQELAVAPATVVPSAGADSILLS